MDFIDNLANNDIFLTVLVVVLIFLIIAFFVVLFMGGKKEKVKEVKVEEDNSDNSVENNNIDFNHDEYVKEATLEFELSPVQDIKATLNEVQLDKIEESPAYHVDETSTVDSNEMNNFSFDELSKMISDELNNIEKEDTNVETPEEKVTEEVKKEPTIPQVTFVDSFKEVDSKPEKVEFETVDENSTPRFDSVFINKVVNQETEAKVELPKLADDNKKTSEPVLKEENVPLYARFNQESYDINEKD